MGGAVTPTQGAHFVLEVQPNAAHSTAIRVMNVVAPLFVVVGAVAGIAGFIGGFASGPLSSDALESLKITAYAGSAMFGAGVAGEIALKCFEKYSHHES